MGISKTPYRVSLRNGLRFNVRPGTDDTSILFEIFIRRCYDAAVVESGATVVDIGANIGLFSVLAAQRAARVVACEPHPGNLSILRRNAELNHANNIEVVAAAISATTGTSSLVLPDDDAFVGRYSLHPGRGTRSIEVPSIALDDLVMQAGLTHIDLVKIDCQGSEYEILYGAAPDVLSRIAQIVVECEVFPTHPGWSQSELSTFLKDRGFRVVDLGNILYASRGARGD